MNIIQLLAVASTVCFGEEALQSCQTENAKLTTQLAELQASYDAINTKYTDCIGDLKQCKFDATTTTTTTTTTKKKVTTPPTGGKVKELTDDDFKSFVKGSDSPTFALMYAEWCGHCKALKPDWKKLAKELADKNINIVQIDVDQHRAIGQKFKVKGFPTLIWLPKDGKPSTYKQGRDFDSLKSFVMQELASSAKFTELTDSEDFSKSCNNGLCIVAVVNEDNYDSSRKELNKALGRYMELDAKYIMIKGAQFKELESSLGLVDPVYPHVMAVNLKKGTKISMTGAVTAKDVSGFFKKIHLNASSLPVDPLPKARSDEL